MPSDKKTYRCELVTGRFVWIEEYERTFVSYLDTGLWLVDKDGFAIRGSAIVSYRENKAWSKA